MPRAARRSLPLGRAGLNVVALEAGPRLDGRAYPSDEILMAIRNNTGRKHNQEVPTWRRNMAQRAIPIAPFGNMVNAVGGTSIHYNSQSWRLDAWTFKMRSEVMRRYGASAFPPGTTLEDMPVTYEELEPYYELAEYAIGIAGKAGNLNGKLDQRGNVLESPRKREYPMPALRLSGWQELLHQAARRLGWHPFVAPAAVNTIVRQDRPVCTYCGFCAGIGCHSGAKSSTDVSTVPAAERTGNVDVVTGARVTRILVDGDGKASGVAYVRGGKEFVQPAGVVLLAAYAWENTRLLLLSKSSAYPNGLANNHNQVGKHYFTHAGPTTFGLFPGLDLNRWNGQGSQAMHVDDWEADNFDHAGMGFIGGGSIDGRSEQKPIGMTRSTPPNVPLWGSAWKTWIKRNVNKVGSIGSGGGTCTLPYEQYFLDLDPEFKDGHGEPVVRVTYDYTDNENKMHTFLRERQRQWLLEAGASETWSTQPVPNPRSVHAYGGTRMGTNVDTNVANRWGMAHEVPNLGFLGGSRDGRRRRPQPDADRAGARVAHGRAHRAQLQEPRSLTTVAAGVRAHARRRSVRLPG